MSWTAIRGFLRQRRSSAMWYSLGLAAYGVAMVWYYPYIKKVNYQELLQSIPDEMLRFFAGSGGGISLAKFGGYLATEYLGFMWIVAAAAAMVTLAARAVAGEVDAGTMELLLSLPVSRTRLLISRIVAMVAYAVLLAVATVMPLWVTARVQDVDVDAGHLALLGAVALLMLLAIGGVALLLSSVSRRSGRPAGIVAGMLAAMWIVEFLAPSADWADALRPFTLFRYWNPAGIIDAGTVPERTWVVLGAVAVVTLAGSVIAFSRRDVA